MIYNVIGTMSGSSMDGLDIVYARIEEVGGNWSFEILQGECVPFSPTWTQTLHQLGQLSARDIFLTHTALGRWMGDAIQTFIQQHQLEHKVHLVASHGHTVFHDPAQGTSVQLGDGASIAAITRLPVVSDLRNMDIALGGQGAPIVPIGEKLFWKSIPYFLNIGGIANISIHANDRIAFDVCPANRVLNLLVNELGKVYDDKGQEAAKGNIHDELLAELNDLDYYQQQAPKSLANEFGTDVVFACIQRYDMSIQDKLATMCEHIAVQLWRAVQHYPLPTEHLQHPVSMMVTGGGAHHTYLVERIQFHLAPLGIHVEIPDSLVVDYKEALVMGLIGILRWREEVNVLSSVTGASRDSVGGALWMGQD
jgi:anhydro-N-acetylmuramic acid kinase